MRSNSRNFKFSTVIIIAALFLIASAGASRSTSAALMQSTMAGTMAGTMDGPFPPCPPVMDAMMAGTKDAMMAGTKDAMMAGTKDAMAEMMTNACHYYAELAGANEAPKPGAPKGKGTIELNFSRPATGPGEVCYSFKVEGIKLPASAAHIHKGAKGVAGPVVIPFPVAPDAKGMAQGCAQKVDRQLMADILMHPSEYYVNVHTSDFPNGAIRGQIELAEMGSMGK